MVNLFFLQTFVDTAKTSSLKAAAHKNFVTQPAVSQHLRLLEQKLGCKLFERHNKKIFLTPSGKTLLTYAQSILNQYEEARVQINEMNERSAYTLRLATVYSVGLYELQPIVRHFLKLYPTVDIHLEYQPFDKIYDMAARNEIDFGFVAYPKTRHHIQCEVFANEKMVIAQSPAHRVIKSRRIKLCALNGVKFAAFAWNTPTRGAIDAFLHEHQCTPKIVNEYDNIETLKSAVTLGIGCAILPYITVRREIKDGALELLPAKDLTLRRPVGILYTKNKKFNKATHGFLDCLLKLR